MRRVLIEADGWETAWPDLQASARELRLMRPWPKVPPLRDRGCSCFECASEETRIRASELGRILRESPRPPGRRWPRLVLPRESLPAFAVEVEVAPRWS